MPHAVFTIVSPVHTAREAELRELLQAIDHDPDGNPHLRFGQFPAIHFASFTIFPDDEGRETLLVFEHNVDGSAGAHLNELIRKAGPGLRAIYRCCADFPTGEVDDAALKRYLAGHSRTPHLFHVGTPYRLANNIRAERELRRFLDVQADALAGSLNGQSPAEVWRALRRAANVPDGATRDHVPEVDWSTGTVSWVLRPEARWPSRILHWTIFLVMLLAAVALVGWLAGRAWGSQTTLTVTLVGLSVGLGAWTAVLLGWPARRHWRHPLNIVIWFGAIGWIASLVPALTALFGISAPWPIGPASLALAYVVVFAQLVGRWTLPTPELDRPQADPALLSRVREQEDRDVNNHMSAMVQLRPGLYRRLALHIVLWSLNWAWFQTFLRDVSKGRLFTFATVHFAQWVVLDDKRYLFLSNYDHSWSRYLDDFGYITFGLARLWGQGRRSPGLGSLEAFKDFSRSWMQPHAVWYRAYPDTSVTQVWNNEKLRLGLLEDADNERSQELLARLVASEER